MFDLLAAMYRDGTITKAQLDQYVAMGFITQEQEDEIVAANGNVGVLVVTAATESS